MVSGSLCPIISFFDIISFAVPGPMADDELRVLDGIKSGWNSLRASWDDLEASREGLGPAGKPSELAGRASETRWEGLEAS